MARLTEEIVECLERLRSQGFVPPLTFTCIAANSVICAGRYTGAWDALQLEPLHGAAASLQLPVHCLFVDDRGEAAGFLLAPHDTYFLPWPSLLRSVIRPSFY